VTDIDKLNMYIGSKVRELRVKKKFTQADVAKLLGYRSISFISEIEAGSKTLSVYKIFLLNQVLDGKLLKELAEDFAKELAVPKISREQNPYQERLHQTSARMSTNPTVLHSVLSVDSNLSD